MKSRVRSSTYNSTDLVEQHCKRLQTQKKKKSVWWLRGHGLTPPKTDSRKKKDTTQDRRGVSMSVWFGISTWIQQSRTSPEDDGCVKPSLVPAGRRRRRRYASRCGGLETDVQQPQGATLHMRARYMPARGAYLHAQLARGKIVARVFF
jgi:hypothetical protein